MSTSVPHSRRDTAIIPYIGGKHMIAGKIAAFLQATGADTLVDVFGGSAAVVMNAGFTKRIYNDADGDLVNLFRVIACGRQRPALLRTLRYRPHSRKIFDEDSRGYRRHGNSFAFLSDPIERARATFYRHQYSFGGKTRCGGFACSTADRVHIKESFRYGNALKRIVVMARFWRETTIEALHYADAVSIYGRRPNVVLFCDPPYVGTECLYSYRFREADHVFLAHQLTECTAHVVCTYYDHPTIRALYPDSRWTWTAIAHSKNIQSFRGGKRSNAKVNRSSREALEWLLVKRMGGQ